MWLNSAKLMEWKDKIVFLTGASSGIGEALAIAIAGKGATLGLLARREELLTDLATRCESAGATCTNSFRAMLRTRWGSQGS